MNPLNIIHAIAGVVSAVVVGVAIKEHSSVVKTERAKREEIRLNCEREILAIRRAGMTVQEQILRGYYDSNIGNCIPEIMSDMKFYTIADRFKD